jgi:hypothetical protein
MRHLSEVFCIEAVLAAVEFLNVALSSGTEIVLPVRCIVLLLSGRVATLDDFFRAVVGFFVDVLAEDADADEEFRHKRLGPRGLWSAGADGFVSTPIPKRASMKGSFSSPEAPFVFFPPDREEPLRGTVTADRIDPLDVDLCSVISGSGTTRRTPNDSLIADLRATEDLRSTSDVRPRYDLDALFVTFHDGEPTSVIIFSSVGWVKRIKRGLLLVRRTGTSSLVLVGTMCKLCFCSVECPSAVNVVAEFGQLYRTRYI